MRRIARELAIAAAVFGVAGALMIAVLAACIALVPFAHYWIVCASIAAGYIIALAVTAFTIYIRGKNFQDGGDLPLKEIYGSEVGEEFSHGKIGIIVTDERGFILYQSEYLSQGVNLKVTGRNIAELSDRFKNLMENTSEAIPQTHIDIESRRYEVEYIKHGNLFILKDVTALKNKQRDYLNSAPIVAFARIDKYDELVTTTDEVTLSRWMNRVRDTLFDIAEGKYFIKSISSDTYMILGQFSNAFQINNGELDLISRVRNISVKGNEPLSTISIGAAYDYPDMASACDSAMRNLDMAEARGGDQALISHFADKSDYIGGKTESKASINRAKIRLLSKGLIDAIKGANLVLTMGHYNADFDSIGACLGIRAIAQSLGVNCRIVYAHENTEAECAKAFEEFCGEDLKKITIPYSEALGIKDSKTLIVLVDVSQPERLVYPNFISYDSDVDVAIVDHHRRSNQTFKRCVYDGSDSSASSACELLASYIENAPLHIDLPSRVATLMLAGTIIDTTRFRSKVSEPTFRAMSFLMNRGASTTIANQITKEDYQQFKEKIKFLQNTQKINGNICLAINPDHDEIVSPTMLAMVANQAMTISENDAAFAISRVSTTKVGISGRSNRDFNVESVLKKLGGGGHFSAAATTIESTDVNEVVSMLTDVLTEDM